ncbi:9343_t:CDS:2 [Acaulospora colombiana]|uniref:9343_t:CDS:1 n=1 Tax=Acaulospora colombiana TaxID=27376 RepID=A0ACA9K955_9GLOM|nr:9343_t:CDS:2 [Acaulospora colombiana]
MNSFGVTAQEKLSEAVQYYSVGEPAPTNEKHSQRSSKLTRANPYTVVEPPQQVVEQPLLAVKNEEDIFVSEFEDQKEHSPTPSSKNHTLPEYIYLLSKREQPYSLINLNLTTFTELFYNFYSTYGNITKVGNCVSSSTLRSTSRFR